MPLGLNRTDLNSTGVSFRNGTPVTEPLDFGNDVMLPHNFGNPIPSSGTNQNIVNWLPSPSYFGNEIGGGSLGSYILQADSVSRILLADLSGALLVS